MRVLALGPLEIEGAVLRALSAAKHRALLTVLLINANRVVTLGSLIDELWETPPPTATNLVRQYVSHLRRSLTELGAAGVELRTHACGYTLLVSARTSDVADFEELLRQGRTHLDAGRPVRAADLLGAALALWRGRPYGDVPDGPTITAERARLEEMRVGALELRTRAQLEVGNFAEAISDLTSLIIRHPLREGLHANLMRALAATGRKADALRVYHNARETLVNELGLEPSAELRQVERAILADEYDERVTVTPPPPPSSLAQIPCGLTDFVGRATQIRQLDSHLSGDHRGYRPPVVVLCGPGGVGKTALAVQVGHEVGPSFPDGQVFLRLSHSDGEPVSPVAALGQAIEILGCRQPEQPHAFLAKQDLYRRLLAGRRTLVILDDVVNEAQVRPLLPGRGECAVLVTSRSRLTALDGARHRPVPSFTAAESVELIARVAGSDRVTNDDAAAWAIAAACGGLPIAVRAAAAQAENQPHRSLRHIADRLTGANIFEELAVGDVNVRDTVAATYSALDPAERRVLFQLRVAEPMAPVAEGDLRATSRSIDRLVEAGVLEPAGTDSDGQLCFRCSELVRRYAQERVVTDEVPAPVTRLEAA